MLGFFSMYSEISGARPFLEFPAKSFNKSNSVFNINDNF